VLCRIWAVEVKPASAASSFLMTWMGAGELNASRLMREPEVTTTVSSFVGSVFAEVSAVVAGVLSA
jgi:hypothetical protein